MSQKYFTSKSIKLIVALAICVLLVFLNPWGIFSSLRAIFLTIGYPVEKIYYVASTKIERTREFISSISDLKKENNKLIEENNNLVAEVVQLKDQKEENIVLREQLKLLPRDKFATVSAFVIGQDPQKLGSWLMIDQGINQGIREGMPVIVSGGILIGRILEVYPESAKVDLLTSASSSINAVDLETDSKGIVRGEYGLGIILDMVSQTDIINVGDTVSTSGLGSDTPKGLLIGKIQELRSTDDKLFQQALISPRVKYSKLDVVFVIKNSLK